jgi:hypothetical protein
MSPAQRFLAGVEFDLVRNLRRAKNRTKGPLRILAEALVINAEIQQAVVDRGWVSTPDYYSKDIQAYEHSALGSSRVI